jgi:hypothetical protein
MDFKSETPNQEENAGKIKTHNTDWLKELEVQSWQAELVLSGLIITGLFQFPDVFINWAETSIIKSGEIEYSFLNIASLLVLVGIDCLVILFGIHLLFRGIWIALLGLNSVYPDGINVHSKSGMGEKYWQKAKEKYPNLMAYNIELDANCSLLFSMAAVTIIVMSSFSVIILVFYQCFSFLVSIYPNLANYIMPIGLGIYGVFALLTFLIRYLSKKYPDSERIEKIVTGYGNVMENLTTLYIFRKPIGYITSTYTSNSQSSSLKFVIAMVVSGLVGFMGARHMGQSEIANNFAVERYFVFNNKPHQIMAFNYENLMDKDAQIYTPIIQSDIITDDFVKVFIPTIEREIEHINFKEPTILERLQRRMKTAQRDSLDKVRFEAYKQFNRLYINDVEQPNLDYQFYTHPQAAERGLMVYVPSEHFVKGRNILEIRKNYFSKEGVQKVVKIPFFFEKKQ